jgi:hypothetical protein
LSGKTVNSIIFYLGLGGAPVSHGGTSPERSKMRWELDETVMDSRKRIYHGVQNDEGCLLVVVAGVGTLVILIFCSPVSCLVKPFGHTHDGENHAYVISLPCKVRQTIGDQISFFKPISSDIKIFYFALQLELKDAGF